MPTLYGRNGGGNWSAATSWSTVATKSSARVAAAVAPLATDDCILDDYSGNIIVDTATCTCKTLNCTTNGNYAGTLTFTALQILNIKGNTTFASTMTLVGTGTLQISATSALTSGGKTFPGDLNFSQNLTTKTLVDNWTVTGLFTTTNIQVVNGTDATHGNMTLNGGITMAGSCSGTSVFTLGGGVWSGIQALLNSLTFAGNSTISGTVAYRTGTLKYISGTITTTGSTLSIAANTTLDTNGIVFNIIYINGTAATITLASDLACNSLTTLLRLSSASNIIFSGAFDITVANLILSNLEVSTWTFQSGQTLNVTNSLFIMTGGGNTTINASTPSSDAYLIYTGTMANCVLGRVIFTDINATGSTANLPNYNGGTLTRTTNITNKTAEDFGGNSSNIFGILG